MMLSCMVVHRPRRLYLDGVVRGARECLWGCSLWRYRHSSSEPAPQQRVVITVRSRAWTPNWPSELTSISLPPTSIPIINSISQMEMVSSLPTHACGQRRSRYPTNTLPQSMNSTINMKQRSDFFMNMTNYGDSLFQICN